MKFNKNKVCGIAFIILASIGGIFIYQVSKIPAYEIYAGSAVFRTEKAYTEFKEELTKEEILNWEADILSSAPPILATFRIETESDYYFPYGEKRTVSEATIPKSTKAKLAYPFLIAGVIVGGTLLSIDEKPLVTRK